MSLTDKLLDLLYPKRCIFCRRLTVGGDGICPLCRRVLPETKSMACQSFSHVESCCSPLFYTGNVRSSLLRYKFGGAAAYAEVYGEFMAKCIDENGISCDSITWVPLSRRRLRLRGYDQARLLAQALAARLELPCVPLLRKLRNNPAQARIGNAEKRRANVKDVYGLLPGAELPSGRILLVDDIVTTGATLSACAAVLKKAGAKQVYACTAARKKV
jgi:ComF family protein